MKAFVYYEHVPKGQIQKAHKGLGFMVDIPCIIAHLSTLLTHNFDPNDIISNMPCILLYGSQPVSTLGFNINVKHDFIFKS